MAYRINEISSLSLAEYIKIVGHYNSLLTGDVENESKVQARGYSEAALAEMKKQKEEKFSPIESLGFRFTKPLNNFKSDLLSYSLLLFESFERGLLPFPGSVSEQPAQIMEIFSLLQSLRFEQQNKLRKKIENNVRHNGKGKPRATR